MAKTRTRITDLQIKTLSIVRIPTKAPDEAIIFTMTATKAA